MNGSQWCERHWSPVRLGQSGLGPAVNGIALSMSVTQEILVEVSRRGGEPNDPVRCNAIIQELSPLCCFLGDEKMQALTLAATTIRGAVS
jgi:hypothetical protein